MDATVADLRRDGFELFSEPVDEPYLWREAILLDPDGHRVFIYHAGEMRLSQTWRLTG